MGPGMRSGQSKALEDAPRSSGLQVRKDDAKVPAPGFQPAIAYETGTPMLTGNRYEQVA